MNQFWQRVIVFWIGVLLLANMVLFEKVQEWKKELEVLTQTS